MGGGTDKIASLDLCWAQNLFRRGHRVTLHATSCWSRVTHSKLPRSPCNPPPPPTTHTPMLSTDTQKLRQWGGVAKRLYGGGGKLEWWECVSQPMHTTLGVITGSPPGWNWASLRTGHQKMEHAKQPTGQQIIQKIIDSSAKSRARHLTHFCPFSCKSSIAIHPSLGWKSKYKLLGGEQGPRAGKKLLACRLAGPPQGAGQAPF